MLIIRVMLPNFIIRVMFPNLNNISKNATQVMGVTTHTHTHTHTHTQTNKHTYKLTTRMQP